jgi:hypothetical protein
MFGNKNENDDLNKLMEKMNISRKVHWTNDTINNEYLKTEKNEKILKRQKTPMKTNFQNQ